MRKNGQAPDFVHTLDLLIRKGKIREARTHLSELVSPRSSAQSPREHAPWLASLARRTGQYELGLKILHPWVRPSERARHRQPTDHELLEYGAALVNLYALREGREVLSALEGRHEPESYFFQALACVAEWDHAGATHWLELFLSQPGLDPYRRLVGQVNLGLALLLGQRWDQAREQIERNIQTAREKGARLLLVNSLECRTHLDYLAGSQRDAEGSLEETLRVTLDSAAPLRDAFFVEKWRILISHRLKPSKYWLSEARSLQRRARAHRDFETARAIDFHLGRDLKDPKRLTRVYFGSPFQSYRDRIAETARSLKIEIPATYCWVPGPTPSSANPSTVVPLDLAYATAPTGLLPKLLTALSSDHYRPQPLLALHEKIYPGNHFNPQSSRDQMHQALKRLREQFSSRSLALEVRELRGSYFLEGSQSLVLHREPFEGDARIQIARTALRLKLFASSLLAEQLRISKPTAVSLIRQWLEAGQLIRQGSGPGTRYQFVGSASAEGL